MVSVAGSAAAIAQALYLNINYYTRPDGTQFYAPDREPSIDFDPTVDHISRLDNLFVSLPLNGSGFNDLCGQGNPDCLNVRAEGTQAYLGKDLRNAYASCHLSLTGAQQVVGLVAGGFSIADLNAYSMEDLGIPLKPNQITAVITDPAYPQCGFPAVTCADGSLCRPDPVCTNLGHQACCPAEAHDTMTTCNVSCDQGVTGCNSTGSACPDPLSDNETPLDMDMVLGMAPNATIVEFEGSRDSTMLQAMANYTAIRINQFSSSFSFYLDDNGTKALKQMAGQGQTFFQASGDSGAIGDPGYDLRDSDLVTDVGGTQLMMNGNGDSWASESAWSEPIGSGGGFNTDGYYGSPSIAMPKYQQFIDMTANNRGGDNRYRNVPDVSVVARNAEYFWGPRKNAAGTSVSAPVWAGFMALANEQRSQKGVKSTVGFANPLLYSLAQNDSTYKSAFNDITVGVTGRTSCDSNHAFCFPYDPAGGFPAEQGYDLATGLGSPQCALIDLLQGAIPRHVTVTANVDMETCECGSCGNSSGGTIQHPSASGTCDLNAANPTCTIDLSNYQLCANDLGVFVRSTLTLQNDDSVTVCPQDWWADGDGCGRDHWKWSGSGPCTTVAPNANFNIDTNGLSAYDPGSCCGGLQGCPTYETTAIVVDNADAQ